MHDMSAHAHVAHPAPPTSFIRKYIFSLDHKVIGKQYYGLALVAVLVGMFLSWLMRIHLGWTNLAIPGLHLLSSNGAPGNVMTPEFYLQLMTMHATIMVFFVLTTAPFAGFCDFFLPIQVGAEDMPFPRFNMMSFWVTFVAFVVLVSSFFVGDGPTLGGWTQYAPLSAVGSVAGPGEGTGVVLWATSIALFCVGQLLGALNFITTTLDMRTRGMSLWRLPLSAWAWFITSCMGLAAFAVLMPACILLILDHVAGTSFFVPSNLVISDQVQPHSGGSTLLWQHLFWFFGHPEVYVAIVPGMGIISHVLITSMRKPLLSHRVVVYSMGALAVLSYVVLGVAAMFGIFAGTYFWFPKMFGRMMNETLGKIHFWCSFVGTYCIFMPFHYLGMAGNVRRYQAFVNDYTQPLIPLHRFITVAALFTGAAQLIFVYNLIHSRFWGKPAPDNPWQATSLEWSTPSTPPPHQHFGTKLPEVYHDPYQYGVESSVGEYVMQASPEEVETAQGEA